jgi:hypothetical protein
VRYAAGRRSEPSGERVDEPPLGQVSHPGHVSVGPNQHGGGSSDHTECRKLPWASVLGVDQLNPVRPWSDVEAAGLTEVDEHGPSTMQQGEDPQRAVGDQVEIGHARVRCRRPAEPVPCGRPQPAVPCR